MVRLPRGFHPQAARRRTSTFSWAPGWAGTGQQPISRVPVGRYTRKISSVPINGGQAQGVIDGAGACTLQVAPQGMGTTWYPAQVTVSTTTGALDTSTCLVYLGPAVTPATQVGSVYTGNGVAALAIPSLSPGQTLIARWTGGHPGDIAAMNVVGSMDALGTG